MGDAAIALYIVGALLTVYVLAATWQSKDAVSHVREKPHPRTAAHRALDRRIVHWWRARRRSNAAERTGAKSAAARLRRWTLAPVPSMKERDLSRGRLFASPRGGRLGPNIGGSARRPRVGRSSSECVQREEISTNSAGARNPTQAPRFNRATALPLDIYAKARVQAIRRTPLTTDSLCARMHGHDTMALGHSWDTSAVTLRDTA